jgi:hypothetical protein
MVAAASIAIACSDGDDSVSDASSASEVTVMGGDASDDGQTAATLSDGRPTLAAVVARRADARTKVTYQRGDDTFTIAQDGRRRAVRSESSLVLIDGDTTVSCEEQPEPTCLELPPEVRDLAVSTDLTLYSLLERGLDELATAQPLLATTDATIADRAAACITVRAGDLLADVSEQVGELEELEEEARVCVDAETGFILEFSTDRATLDDLVAVSVEKPTDADFEPPAAVDPLPDDDPQETGSRCAGATCGSG